ncbi:MAG TPA: 16S rRNA (uracil(1498)-N(3))-methyltransferase [Jatrophihabitans sp.]|nr:16S rRNA (uracil(1498)-N(3))-methyltransferase [Jatrophihabitans sp.]
MGASLFLIDALPDGPALHLGGDEGRHAARVQRIGVGETVLVGDGRGTVLTCSVVAVLPDGLSLTVREQRSHPAPVPRLVVVQALPKGDRGELAVELLTELGVDEIVPWAASRSIAHWTGPRGEKALAKWRRTAHEATKQSRRAWRPEVAPLHPTAQVAQRIAAAANAFVLHEDATSPLVSTALDDGGEVVVVVGPEGGVAPAELEAFTSAGAIAVRLGEPVLRTSTAGAAALAVLSVRLGRWN